MKKILIVDQPINNRGDEAAHKSLVRNLNQKLPYAQITILFQNVEQNSVEQMKVEAPQNRYFNIQITNKGAGLSKRWGLRLGLLRLSTLHPANYALIKYIKDADLIICAPGGISMGLFQNWGHIYILSLALLFRKKVAYYSRSFGPFPVVTKWNKIYKKISYNLLKNFDFISIRDAKTMHLADQIGISYIPSIDTAFLDTPYVKLPSEIKTIIGEKEYVVFVPNSLTWHAAFKNCAPDYLYKFYTSIIELLLSKYENANIIMLPQLFNIGDKGDNNYFEKIKSQTNTNRIIVLQEIYGSDIQQTIISNAKLMIGARYHSVVFAINNEIPFVALSYEHKISGLLEILNLQKYMFDIEQLGKNELNINEAVCEIGKIIEFTESAPEAKQNAQVIAQNCMEKFIKRYSE